MIAEPHALKCRTVRGRGGGGGGLKGTVHRVYDVTDSYRALSDALEHVGVVNEEARLDVEHKPTLQPVLTHTALLDQVPATRIRVDLDS